MGALISFLWPKHAAVVQQYAAQVPSKIHTLFDVYSALSEAEKQAIRSDAAERAQRIAAELNDSPRAALITANLAENLADSMTIVASLDALHERDGVELVVLNEDVTRPGKTGAAWDKARGIPSVVLSHSEILGRLYTVHREDNTSALAVYGQRGAQPYLDMGMAKERIAVTGNPAWDIYAGLISQRDAIRQAFRAQYGFSERDHIVVFATTWPAFFTAFCEKNDYESSLRAVVRSVRELRELGVPVQLVIKERPSNADKQDALTAILREEAIGFTPIVANGELEKWVVAADAVVSVDSNVSVECMIAGTPAINLWTPMSWLNGPFFDAEDGVLQAPESMLSLTLVQVLGNPEIRAQVRAQAQARSAEFAPLVGTATARAAELLVKSRKPVARESQRYVWQELSSPKSVSEKGTDSVYYRSARHDMLAHVRQAPRVMLDVGCGAGATGEAVKQRFPDATVVGIEINPEAAAMAKGRIDRVISANVEQLDFEAAGFSRGSIDLVFFPDVLEHLYDPWQLLVRLKPFLSAQAQVVASIPNVRNLWLLSHMIGGDWKYAEEGLLDVTHIRFFTKKTIVELFEQTGYTIRTIFSNADGRVPAMQAPPGGQVNIDMPNVMLKNMSEQDLIELRTLQFVIDAAPVR